MREQWGLYEKDPANSAAAAAAANAAKDAAPYIHPRLSQTDKPVSIGPLAGDLSDKAEAVTKAMSEGAITPNQAATIMQALSAQARIIEVDELEKRIAALEQQRGEQ